MPYEKYRHSVATGVNVANKHFEWSGVSKAHGRVPLTLWGWEKMAPLCRQHFQLHSLHGKVRILIKISSWFIPKGSVDNKSVLVQIIPWHLTGHYGDKPFINWTNDGLVYLRVCINRHRCVDNQTGTKYVHQSISDSKTFLHCLFFMIEI